MCSIRSYIRACGTVEARDNEQSTRETSHTVGLFAHTRDGLNRGSWRGFGAQFELGRRSQDVTAPASDNTSRVNADVDYTTLLG